MIGSRLGPYEITAKLGEGGMGEVYRATDSKLRREVAIKVLPAAFTADRERLARFEREAQLLAQLNHSNIAQIYGIEASGESRALVMELVEGPTLAERLEAGPLSPAESSSVALQIAQALEEAHEKGIVHRDLKPQNIKASTDGKVKVLDFGLAKAMEPAGGVSSAEVANSPTVTFAATRQGVILGTAAYMAPEQARGAAVDKRVDIWAFGVVLYEMLTGERLFDGASVVDTLSAVMRKEIDFGRLPAATPRRVRDLLRRCLERNPKNRLHDIADARLELEEQARGGADESLSVAASSIAAGRRSKLAAVAAAAALALGLGLVAGWLLRRPAPPPLGAGARWALAIPDGLVLSTLQAPQIALSDDGRRQVAVVVDGKGESRLLLRSIDEVEPRVLADTEGAVAPFFSPDGAWIGFFRERALLKMPAAGGTPVQLTPSPMLASQVRGASWSRDGFVYFAPSVQHPLSRVPTEGGAIEVVTKLDAGRDERTHRFPQALPDGKVVIFTCDTATSTEFYDDARIEALIVATGERRVLVEGASQARFGGGDRLIFARGGTLFAIRFDPTTLSVSGSPEPVVQNVATDVSSGAVQFALSPAGAALWVPGGLLALSQFYWIERDGSASPAPIAAVQYNEAALAPKGRRVALVGGPQGASDLWVAELERGAVSRLSQGEPVSNPVWTPDGSRIAYQIRASGADGRRHRIAWRVADGSRDAEILLESDREVKPSGFTPDGSRLLFTGQKKDGRRWEVSFLPIAGAREPELLLTGDFSNRDAVISPDGRLIAYASNESGVPTVFVRPFPSGEGRWQVSPGVGIEPRWGPDQKELYYRSATDILRVPIESRAGFSAGRPEVAVDRVSLPAGINSYSIAAGGRIFAARTPDAFGGRRTLHLDLDFARRLAGAGSPARR